MDLHVGDGAGASARRPASIGGPTRLTLEALLYNALNWAR